MRSCNFGGKRRVNPEEWDLWFAWHPVKVTIKDTPVKDGIITHDKVWQWVWLEIVERKWIYYNYEYRLLGANAVDRSNSHEENDDQN